MWPRLLAGHSGISSTNTLPNTAFADVPSRVAGIVPRGHLDQGCWNPDDHLSTLEQRQTALFSQYAIAAAEEALDDSAVIQSLSTEDKETTGVVIGSGIGNLEDQYDASIGFASGGHRKMHPLFVPRLLINMAAGRVAMRHGFLGPNLAPTTACTTGLHALIHGAQLIQSPGVGIGDIRDSIDVVITGASEACIHPLAMSGFARARSLSTKFNDTPTSASRPFDRDRDGFVIGEGAGVMILEERERAINRGANIYAELIGMGMSCDASHITAPRPDGKGAQLAMNRALMGLRLKWVGGCADVRTGPDSQSRSQNLVGYINAHATGTRVGDAVECAAMDAVFQNKIDKRTTPPSGRTAAIPTPVVGSTKGATGHMLGAAGAVEAVFTVLSMRDGMIPPTLNLDNIGDFKEGDDSRESVIPLDGYELEFVRSKREWRKPLAALTNSFGFGGTNASTCFVKHSQTDTILGSSLRAVSPYS